MSTSAAPSDAGALWREKAGRSSDSLVVLVHGSMDRSAGVLRLSRQLDGDHRVLRYDRRGYARSAKCGPPWSVEANIDDLAGLLDDEAEPHERQHGAVVFGHSFGGNVALGLAARRPDLVRALVVYETPLSWLDWWPRDSAGAAAMAATDSGDAAEAFMRRLVGNATWDRIPATKQTERRAEGAAMVAELADLRRSAPWLGTDIEVPVLALYGEHARAHHRTAMEGLSELIADCRSAVVPNAGHAGPHTHPDAVAEAVRVFLARLTTSAVNG